MYLAIVFLDVYLTLFTRSTSEKNYNSQVQEMASTPTSYWILPLAVGTASCLLWLVLKLWIKFEISDKLAKLGLLSFDPINQLYACLKSSHEKINES
jgi:hypothetical protein